MNLHSRWHRVIWNSTILMLFLTYSSLSLAVERYKSKYATPGLTTETFKAQETMGSGSKQNLEGVNTNPQDKTEQNGEKEKKEEQKAGEEKWQQMARQEKEWEKEKKKKQKNLARNKIKKQNRKSKKEEEEKVKNDLKQENAQSDDALLNKLASLIPQDPPKPEKRAWNQIRQLLQTLRETKAELELAHKEARYITKLNADSTGWECVMQPQADTDELAIKTKEVSQENLATCKKTEDLEGRVATIVQNMENIHKERLYKRESFGLVLRELKNSLCETNEFENNRVSRALGLTYKSPQETFLSKRKDIIEHWEITVEEWNASQKSYNQLLKEKNNNKCDDSIEYIEFMIRFVSEFTDIFWKLTKTLDREDRLFDEALDNDSRSLALYGAMLTAPPLEEQIRFDLFKDFLDSSKADSDTTLMFEKTMISRQTEYASVRKALNESIEFLNERMSSDREKYPETKVLWTDVEHVVQKAKHALHEADAINASWRPC